MTKVTELFGLPTLTSKTTDWDDVVKRQQCPYLDRKCLKTRKSEPTISIGTCTVRHGAENKDVIICPFRMLERNQIFIDCIHLLTLHEPGNELHIVPGLKIPGGNIDYCLTSVRSGSAVDFVGIEIQTLDTTGTAWPERQRFLHLHGLRTRRKDVSSSSPLGMNWKMTAKTILMQLHHKIATFENISKHLVLITQDALIDNMKANFAFSHLQQARLGDSMHFHSYQLSRKRGAFRLELESRLSTDAVGIAKCLDRPASAKIEVEQILTKLTGKLSPQTLMTITRPPSPPTSLVKQAEGD